EELTRAVVTAAYARGARYVDVIYHDPWVKRARVEHADPATLDYVPPWLSSRLVGASAERAARIGFAGVVAPEALEGLDGGRPAPPPEHPVGGGLHGARPSSRRWVRHLDTAARAQGRHDRAGPPRAVRGRPRGRGRRRRERGRDSRQGRDRRRRCAPRRG